MHVARLGYLKLFSSIYMLKVHVSNVKVNALYAYFNHPQKINKTKGGQIQGKNHAINPLLCENTGEHAGGMLVLSREAGMLQQVSRSMFPKVSSKIHVEFKELPVHLYQ